MRLRIALATAAVLLAWILIEAAIGQKPEPVQQPQVLTASNGCRYAVVPSEHGYSVSLIGCQGYTP
jgi:hypothetical protein